MDFRYADEHDQLRSSVRRLLSDVASDGATRKAMESDRGWDADAYARLAQELGVVGLGIPEEHGGAGYGVLEVGVVLQEAGRALLCAPLLSNVVAAHALLATGDTEACSEHLPGIVAGTLLATLAPHERARDRVRTQAEQNASGGWQLTGEKHWVLDAQTAQLLVVPARGPDGVSLFLLDAGGEGVTVTPLPGVDPTRRQADVLLDAAPATMLGRENEGEPALRRALDLAEVLLAAEQVGVAERCLEMATEYAKQREQFGRPIGSFQAIKHKLADVLLEVEAARSAVMYALWAADHHVEELPVVAGIAGGTCSETALLAAGENIQVHGGIGVTWEHPAHLYLKRATTSRVLYDEPQQRLERLAGGLGLDDRA